MCVCGVLVVLLGLVFSRLVPGLCAGACGLVYVLLRTSEHRLIVDNNVITQLQPVNGSTCVRKSVVRLTVHEEEKDR